ncbi:MAG: tRNA guanosine(34) transglycosylase Tgt [Phycisphaerae bacterium]|jgi:queuine tRNA-ribosyltransferase
MFGFQVTAVEPRGRARCGLMSTARGAVRTPAFMPVGTRAAVRGVWPGQVRESGADILLANTYHLLLRPGPELIAELGGVHRFMAWDGPILTDSGGYQVFSLSDLNEVTDAGVTFRSHIDGQRVHLDPREAMRVQTLLGADIVMCFDECPPGDADRATAARAVERTVRWAGQCRLALAEFAGQRPVSSNRGPAEPPALFGIVQGGVYSDLRIECARRLIELDFPGYAIGGLSVGETHEQMAAVLDDLAWRLPADRPRYLMGVGMPRDILAAVRAGVDLFDCVLPTRNGRRGYAFTATGPLRLRNEQFRRQDRPLEDDCPCPTCRAFSRAYLRHLFMADEMLGPMLVSVHNLWFFQRLMARLRDLIPTGDWATMLAEFPVAAGVGHEPS